MALARQQGESGSVTGARLPRFQAQVQPSSEAEHVPRRHNAHRAHIYNMYVHIYTAGHTDQHRQEHSALAQIQTEQTASSCSHLTVQGEVPVVAI